MQLLVEVIKLYLNILKLVAVLFIELAPPYQ